MNQDHYCCNHVTLLTYHVTPLSSCNIDVIDVTFMTCLAAWVNGSSILDGHIVFGTFLKVLVFFKVFKSIKIPDEKL